MKIHLKNYRGQILFACLLIALAAIHFYQKSLLSYSGDEPRFTYYAYSIVKGEMLKLPDKQFIQETGSLSSNHSVMNLPITLNIHNKTMFMMNSIIAPLLYSPALYFGKAYHSWKLLRTAAFLYYCGALLFMWLSITTIFSKKESLLALAITTLSLPQLAHMSLGNTEQVAIFFLAAAFYYLIFRKMSIFSILIGTLSMCLVVFSSMRSMPLAGSVAVGFLIRLWITPSEVGLDKREKLTMLCIFLGLSIIGAIGWCVFQLSFTGTIAGSSSMNETFNDKPLTWFLFRPFVLMLHHKDGIFLLFPLVFASFLGLINAARKRDLVAWISLSALFFYYCVIALTSQNEGYPGRLQFILAEFFAIGLGFYIRNFRSAGAVGILILGIMASSVVSYMHIIAPSAFLQNRTFGYAQQMILEMTHHLDFGQYLIWDEHSCWTNPPLLLLTSDAWHIIYQVFSFLALVGLFLLASVSNRYSIKVQRSSAWLAFGVTIAGAFSLFVTQVPPQKFLIAHSFTAGHGTLKLIFNKYIGNKATIVFGPQPFWLPPEFPSFFSVAVETENGVTTQYQKRSQPEIRLSALGNIKSITIIGNRTKSPWSMGPIEVYVPILYTLRH